MQEQVDLRPTIFYTYSDQPAMCPNCGNRTTFDESAGRPVKQWHACLSASCRYTFIQVEEDDIQR